MSAAAKSHKAQSAAIALPSAGDLTGADVVRAPADLFCCDIQLALLFTNYIVLHALLAFAAGYCVPCGLQGGSKVECCLSGCKQGSHALHHA